MNLSVDGANSGEPRLLTVVVKERPGDDLKFHHTFATLQNYLFVKGLLRVKRLQPFAKSTNPDWPRSHTPLLAHSHIHTHRQISSQPVNRRTSVSVVCGREPEYLEEAQMKHSGAPQTGVRSRSRSRTGTCKCDAVDVRRFSVPECIIHLFVATRFLSALLLVKF